MSGGVVYHWKHGWIPLDHTAALSHAKGNHAKAADILAASHGSDVGIRNRADLAQSILTLHTVPLKDRDKAHHHIVEAARLHNATDLLPAGLQPHAARVTIRSSDYHGQKGHTVTGTDTHGRRTKLFVPGPRSKAEHQAAKIRSGQQPFSP